MRVVPRLLRLREGQSDGAVAAIAVSRSVLAFRNGTSGTSFCASRQRLVSLGDLQHHQPATTVCELSGSGTESFGAGSPVLSVTRLILWRGSRSGRLGTVLRLLLLPASLTG
jgi:hypothetical protein